MVDWVVYVRIVDGCKFEVQAINIYNRRPFWFIEIIGVNNKRLFHSPRGGRRFQSIYSI